MRVGWRHLAALRGGGLVGIALTVVPPAVLGGGPVGAPARRGTAGPHVGSDAGSGERRR